MVCKNDDRRGECPVCRGVLIPVRRERVAYNSWAQRAWCKTCHHEYVLPDHEPDGDGNE